MKTMSVKASELGTNCWLAVRFSGGECKTVERCKYPEKKTCKAYKDAQVYSVKRIYADNRPSELSKPVRHCGDCGKVLLDDGRCPNKGCVHNMIF
jgi:hypothetical protein